MKEKKIKKTWKNKKIYLCIFWIILAIYISIILLGRQIETSFSFPFTVYQKVTRTEPFSITDSNGKKISAVYIDKHSDKTIFYFHGNGENLQKIEDDLLFISNNFGVNVLCYDYPWYWESKDSPYYENISNISKIFYNFLVDEKKIKKQNIILWGYSIWWAVAIDLASKVEFGKLIITSSFTSRYDMSKAMIGFVAQNFLLLPNSFVSEEKIKNIKVPTLIMHGNKDKLVPYFMGQRLFQNSGANKKMFVEIDKSWHNWILMNYWEELKPIIENFLNDNFENKQILKIWE